MIVVSLSPLVDWDECIMYTQVTAGPAVSHTVPGWKVEMAGGGQLPSSHTSATAAAGLEAD